MVESQQNRAKACSSSGDIKSCMKNQYTWQQVAEKNCAKEAWIIIRGKVYDVTGMCGICDFLVK